MTSGESGFHIESAMSVGICENRQRCDGTDFFDAGMMRVILKAVAVLFAMFWLQSACKPKRCFRILGYFEAQLSQSRFRPQSPKHLVDGKSFLILVRTN